MTFRVEPEPRVKLIYFPLEGFVLLIGNDAIEVHRGSSINYVVA